MSSLRIALVAEGKTDQIVIDAALRAVLGRPFVLTLLQPETSDSLGGAGPLGGGWGGVYQWCQQLVSMQYPVGQNPSLAGFDLVLLHVDADVAGMRYSDANIQEERTDLPCERPCPPPEDSANALRDVLLGWMNLTPANGLPEKWVFCIPSKCVEAWVIAALYGTTGNDILQELECNLALEQWLSRRPVRDGKLIKWKERKYRKIPSSYRGIANGITANWEMVRQHCPQSVRFADDASMALLYR